MCIIDPTMDLLCMVIFISVNDRQKKEAAVMTGCVGVGIDQGAVAGTACPPAMGMALAAA